MLSEIQGTEAAAGLLAGLRRLTYASPLYGYSLLGRAPKRLLGTPPEIVPGSAATGQTILAGQLTVAGIKHPIFNPPVPVSDADEIWLAYYHGFGWLSDLRRVANDSAREQARELVNGWIKRNGRWSSLAWRPDILGERLANWLTHFGFFASNRDQQFLEDFFIEIAREARHLSRTAMNGSTGPSRILALKGLAYCGVALPDNDRWLHQALKLLDGELDKQILSDGGHISRNPSTHLRVFGDLISLRDTLVAAHIDAPVWLHETIDKMAPFLRALRHGDGGLALFNGGAIEEPSIIDWLLARSGVKPRNVSSMPHSGFHRMSSGRTTVIMDAGAPPPPASNPWAHAGTLSFEMSAGRERILVNCGAAPARGEAWRHALRSTAAHSTVIVDDRNSTEIDSDGGHIHPPRHVTAARREVDGSAIIEANLEGYADLAGLFHRRLVMLAPDGGELQGEDRIVAQRNGEIGVAAAVRFHLHPTVQATLIQGGRAVLLKPRRGKGWRFEAGDDIVTLEESIYFESPQTRRRTQQIVLTRALDPAGSIIKWRFTRL